MNTFIQKWCIKWIKSDSKDIYNLKWLLFFWNFYSSNNKNYSMLLNMKNVFCVCLQAKNTLDMVVTMFSEYCDEPFTWV